MIIKVNGNEQTISDGATLSALVEQLELNPQLIAVEVNKQLITRSMHSETVMKEADCVEIVTLVGGG